MEERPLILASGSPRRRELMRLVTPVFGVRTSDADESLAPGISPAEGAVELALRKARAVLALQPPGSPCIVVGADTVVALGDRVLGKPRDRAECVGMLQALSGREHTVYTGVAILGEGAARSFQEATRVEFWPLSQEEIDWYASTEEPYDKAGGYGIQGLGAVLVKGIRGDFYNVVGLPVSRLRRVLRGLL